MSAQLLAEYAHSAHQLDDHTVNQFRYFLPRYFELVAAGRAPSHYAAENCLERLGEAAYRSNWPQDEVEVIDAFFLALFEERLSTPVPINVSGLPDLMGNPVEETLCMVAYCGGDLEALLWT